MQNKLDLHREIIRSHHDATEVATSSDCEQISERLDVPL